MMNNKILRPLLLSFVLLLVAGFQNLQAQNVAVRTNALLWGTETANVSLDFTINRFSSLGITGAWSFSDSWIHSAHVQAGQIEYRYWFTHQPFYSMFVGPVVGIAHYRIDDDASNQIAIPAGIEFGYSWSLSRHWNLEAVYGVGYLYYNRTTPYTVSDGLFSPSGDVLSTDPQVTHHHMFTTINLGLNISYVF